MINVIDLITEKLKQEAANVITVVDASRYPM